MIFSIITVCYNSETTIERTIRSVLNQSYQDYEYILIDGGSTDRTLQIIQQYKSLFHGRMKVASEPDKGIYDAMNKGIQLATGELIGIVNSDDYYELDALEKIVDAYDGYAYTVIYGLLRNVINGKEVMVYMKNHEFLEQDMITHPSCFITKNIYDKFGKYSLEYPYSADYEFMLRLKKEKEIHFIEVYSIISNFSVEGVSKSVKAYRDTLRLRHNYQLMGNTEYYVKMLKTSIAMMLKR